MTTATADAEGAKASAPDRVSLGFVAAGLLAAYGPTYWTLLETSNTEAQGHELLVLAVCVWLIARLWSSISALPAPSRRTSASAAAMLVIGVLMYLFGRTQHFIRIELGSQFFVLAALLVGYRGWTALRRAWFPFFFLFFTVPLPYFLVLAVTGPMKTAVSAVTTQLLYWVGYPIGRSGVVITIGQYELLVATACAGLQTMFTLEALGLLYLNLKGYNSWVRNALLGLLVVPVSFCANVIRVMVLALITFHLGDDVGRGFFHGFAGLALFASALVLLIGVDRLLDWALPERWRS